MANPISIFISYAHKDEPFLEELQTFLKPYERNKTIHVWTDKNIVAGQQWDEMIKTQLANSKIILFLISPDFLASDYINDNEIKSALEKYQSHSLVIIPVIIRPIDMDLLQMKYLQVVPTGAKPVSDWESRDKAWNDVIIALKNVFLQVGNTNSNMQATAGNNNNPGYVQDFKKSFISSKIVTWLFILLIAACIGLFIWGMINRDGFICSTSLGGIGAGILGYFISKKFD